MGEERSVSPAFWLALRSQAALILGASLVLQKKIMRGFSYLNRAANALCSPRFDRKVRLGRCGLCGTASDSKVRDRICETLCLLLGFLLC